MPAESASSPPVRNWVRLLIAFVLAFDLTAFWQWIDGAFQSEFGGHPEEGAHYVAGMFAQDLLRAAWTDRDGQMAGAAGSDTGGIRQYAASPAAVWPPGFALVQYAWGAAFGHSRLAILLLLAALSATTATVLYRTVQKEFGDPAASAAALLWICAPLVRSQYGLVMPGLLRALATLTATVAWGRFLERGLVRDALCAGAFAALAIVGGTPAPALALLAPLSVLFAWQWRRLLRPAAWIAAAFPAAVVLGLPQLHAPPSSGPEYRPLAEGASFYGSQLALAAGLAVAIFALAGACLHRTCASGKSATFASLFALPAAVFASRCLERGPLDAWQVIDAVPALVFLSVAGAHFTARALSPRTADDRARRRSEAMWIVLLALLTLAPSVIARRPKEWSGGGSLADILLAGSEGNRRVLVVSDRRVEGMCIAEVAMRDHERRITLERGSETLAENGRSGMDGRPEQRFLEDDHLTEHMTSGRFHYVILDTSIPHETHSAYHDQVARVTEAEVRRFWPVGESPVIRDGEPQGHPLRLLRIMRGGESPLR